MAVRTGIAVFAHTRDTLLKNLLQSLQRQEAVQNVTLFLDGHHGRADLVRSVARCRDVARQYALARVVEHTGHLGIEKLMIDGLTVMAGAYERIIVLEDDCFPTSSAIRVFEEQLNQIVDRQDVFSVYGHHFLTPSEGETITRFQGWGWATTRDKLSPILDQLRACFGMPEAEYLRWVQERLSDEVRARLDVTPGRDVLNVLRSFFSWDSCTALLTALRGWVHRKTPTQTIYNCGMGPDSTHFPLNDRNRRPPFNLIASDEVWEHYDQ